MSSAFAFTTDNDMHDHHDTNSHPELHLALDLHGALADHDDDADHRFPTLNLFLFLTRRLTSRFNARPESLLPDPPKGPLVLGVALVDFNHQVGPRVEFSVGSIFENEDEEINKVLPFLALPDGAHLAAEDYSYFHLVPNIPNPSTIFGISKRVVVLVSKPIFGSIRDRLGVVTLALFEQKDFSNTHLLVEFYESLQATLRSQLTESGLYMGTSLRELVHEFRHRTLVLLKALILQKKILFYGHPVERLCTYQYSLISLIPGLLQTLQDCGSPPLASRAPTLSRPTSLRTSDRRSLWAYLGLPLDLFGKDAFFQPYLPLQQLDLIRSQSRSFLCGSTNAIVRQQKDIELLVDIESCSIEFRDPKIERAVALTPADRKWVDEIVKDVNDTWETEDAGMRWVHIFLNVWFFLLYANDGRRFKGSDDHLRIKFEEYISAALASVKYGDFFTKGENSGVLITPGTGGDANTLDDFNPIWIAEFKRTNAFDVWQRITDPMLFDIIEPRHPCNGKPSAIADITLRLSEGIQELKLEQQLAPTREAISRTITAGSTNFFKAVEGVKGRFVQRSASSLSVGSTSTGSGTVISTSEVPDGSVLTNSPSPPPSTVPTGVEATANSSKGTVERVGGECRNIFCIARDEVFDAAENGAVEWNVKLPPSVVEAPSSEAAEPDEKTPRESSFSLSGGAESQSHTRKDDDENLQGGDDGGDSDEEPSFGVAL
ncbi:transport protein Avl9-domain-containing protein [Russula emetica]|nr:transport protein Avl9-domain-containing protein [Russula emetica]